MISTGVRLFGYYPSGNGILPLAVTPSGSMDVGVVKISSQTPELGPGAIMCAMYVVSGNSTKGFTWVPLNLTWLK